MWVLLGSSFQEEDFGGYQLHQDIFLGVFDSYELAIAAKERSSVKLNYERLEIIQAEINRTVLDTGVDWHK